MKLLKLLIALSLACALSANGQAIRQPDGNATGLNSATTNVDVSAATAPSTGQTLTATDSTHATWQTPSGGGSSAPSPDTYTYVQEFNGDQPLGSTTIPVNWSKESVVSGGSWTNKNLGWPRFGVARLTCQAATGDGYVIRASDSGAPSYYLIEPLNGNNNWDATFIFRLGPAEGTTTNVRMRVGFMSGGPSADPSTWMGLRYDTNASFGDTGWKFVEQKSGTATTSSSNVAALDNNWHKLRMRSTTAGTVLFSMDGGTETTLSSQANMPTVALAPFFEVVTDTTTAKTLDVDYFSFYATGLGR